jgi:hypothetical protein
MSSTPRIIALCGNPTSGKTEASNIIAQLYGHTPADDGLPLREIAMNYFGLKAKQVFTQEGKLEKVKLNGKEWTVRQILGEIGNAFEEKFGGDIIPLMTDMTYKDTDKLVLGSVRREQGLYWRNKGALVLEISNPLAGPSLYEFDKFNRTYCHATINNDGLARGLSSDTARQDLKMKLVSTIEAF